MIRSLTVCVEYDDFLAITLPRNKRHFDRTMVVTSPSDKRTQRLATRHGCRCHVTNAFYHRGAAFNKGAAVEEAFDVLGRDGWICVWDADIVMPDSIDIPDMREDYLYVPARRILEDPRRYRADLDWSMLPSPTLPEEFDGYFQLFHASAVEKPWYGVDWAHAGGGDNEFSDKFPADKRTRAPFDVLHLGCEGIADLGTRVGWNWRGRATPRIDKHSLAPSAARRTAEIRKMVRVRGKRGTVAEKLPAPPPTAKGKAEIKKMMRERRKAAAEEPPAVPRVIEVLPPKSWMAQPTIREPEPLPEGAMPRRVSLFWTGRMSWLRYMALYSLRKQNPDWEIRLYGPRKPCVGKRWSEPPDDDSKYTGRDYQEFLSLLSVERRTWASPVKYVARAQASDLFQWWLLADEGGFYADMDFLWLQPLEPLRRRVEDADAVFALESGAMAIGFLAGNHRCKLFWDLLSSAVALGQQGRSSYQTYGTDTVYRMALPKGGSTPLTAAGGRALAAMRGKYPALTITDIPGRLVYPFDWREINKIFLEDHELAEDTVGLHWFGGAAVSREWNHLLTEDNWRRYYSTLTRCLQRLFP